MSASLSTHVLDTGRGQPASGVLVELFRSGDFVSRAETDQDGRVAELAKDLEPGTYTLVFHPQAAFFTRVELDVALDEGHFHVPLLVSPYSCTTYRGS